MPPNTVYVGRPSTWGNPYRIHGKLSSPREARTWAVEMYSKRVAPTLDFEPLRGKDICCWCAPEKPCHGDVILERANS